MRIARLSLQTVFKSLTSDWDEKCKDESEILMVGYKEDALDQLDEDRVDWGLVDEKIFCSRQVHELDSLI